MNNPIITYPRVKVVACDSGLRAWKQYFNLDQKVPLWDGIRHMLTVSPGAASIRHAVWAIEMFAKPTNADLTRVFRSIRSDVGSLRGRQLRLFVLGWRAAEDAKQEGWWDPRHQRRMALSYLFEAAPNTVAQLFGNPPAFSRI